MKQQMRQILQSIRLPKVHIYLTTDTLLLRSAAPCIDEGGIKLECSSMSSQSNFPVLGPIIIGTSDIARAKKFYVAVFGVVVDSENKNYVSAHTIDGTRIELEEDSENRFPQWAARNIGTYKNCEFHVADLISFLQSVVEHGGKIVSPPTPRPWGDVNAEFSDCDGNVFLISQRTA